MRYRNSYDPLSPPNRYSAHISSDRAVFRTGEFDRAERMRYAHQLPVVPPNRQQAPVFRRRSARLRSRSRRSNSVSRQRLAAGAAGAAPAELPAGVGRAGRHDRSHQHRRQRPRLAAAGHPRRERQRRSARHDHIQHLRPRPLQHPAALGPAHDHRPCDRRRHDPAGLRRRADRRAERHERGR